jgi:signal peptidase I
VAAIALGSTLFHLHLQPVLTASMRPSFSPGDAVVTRGVDPHSLRVGDIAVFVPPGESAPYAHRITSIGSDSGQVVITTRGDANSADDPWHVTLSGPVAKVVTVVPVVGRPMVWLHQRWSRALAIALLGLSMTALGTRALLSTPRLAAI